MRCARFISPHLSLAQKALQPLSLTRRLTSAATESAAPPSPPPLPPMPPSERVSTIADEISGLTLLEISDLVDVLRNKLDVKEMPIMGVMMPGVSFGGMAAGGAAASAAVPKGEVKEEKTVFDVKLEGFDAAAKIKVIKEVRGFTDLGLKEAKELVEKAPSVLKKGVSKEEAEKIIAKMKEVGAKVSME